MLRRREERTCAVAGRPRMYLLFAGHSGGYIVKFECQINMCNEGPGSRASSATHKLRNRTSSISEAHPEPRAILWA